MFKRVLFIGSATLLAAAILFVTLRADSNGPGANNRAPAMTPQGGSAPLVPFDPRNPNDQRFPVNQVSSYEGTRINPHGQLIKVSGKELKPRPQGVIDVDWPAARIYLHPWQMIEIRARQGTFVAPNNNPRSGRFKGRVVLTLYQCPSTRRLDDGPNSRDINLRLFMEDARFDVELGTVDSLSDVHLTSHMFDFRGTGVHLNWNEGKNRLEHLLIDQGKIMRVRPIPAPDTPPHGTGTGSSSAAASSGAGSGGGSGAKSVGTQTMPAPPTLYRATVDHQVHIRQEDADITGDRLLVYFPLAGNGDDRSFNAPAPTPPGPGGDAGGNQGGPLGATGSGSPASQPAASSTGGTGASGSSASAIDAPLPEDQSMLPPRVDDVVVTWAGPMTIDPEENPPAQLHKSEGMLMRVLGKPVLVSTSRHESATGAGLDYLTAEHRMTLEGSGAFPMAVSAPTMGELHGPRLEIDQAAGTARVPGPGSLALHSESAAPGTGAPKSLAAAPDLTVTWDKQMDVTFFPHAAHASTPIPAPASGATADAGDREANVLGAIKTANFLGSVHVKQQTGFELHADHLALAMDEGASGKQTLQQITADGSVRVLDKGDRGRGALAMSSDALKVDVGRDAHGRSAPTGLHARGHVRAKQEQQTLSAGVLDLGLAMAPDHKPGTGAPDTAGVVDPSAGADPARGIPGFASSADSHLIVRTIHAQDDVEIIAQKGPVKVLADRLESRLDPLTNQQLVSVYGKPGTPAELIRGDGSSLTGQTIRINAADQMADAGVDVDGPGRLVMVAPPPRPYPPYRANAQMPKPPHPGMMAVTWKDRMDFDNANSTADFFGAVETRGGAGLNATDLTCGTLHLTFDKTTPNSGLWLLDPDTLLTPPGIPGTSGASGHAAAPRVPARRDAANPGTPGSAASKSQISLPSDSTSPMGRIHTITARKNVHFRAESFQPNAPKVLASRFSLDGPVLTFNNITRYVRVLGAGQMLMEVFPLPGAKPAPATSSPATMLNPLASPSEAEVQFSGPGDTLFTWGGQLTFDTAENSLLLERGVTMVHVAVGNSKKVQLDCQRFAAELTSSGGLGAAALHKDAQPRIKSAQVDQDVRILNDKQTIVTDHLDYATTPDSRTVTLRADDGHWTVVTLGENKPPLTAQEFRWDLVNNRLEVSGLGRTQESLEQQQQQQQQKQKQKQKPPGTQHAR